MVSQNIASPTSDHWNVVKQILCYLKGAPEHGLLYANHGHTRIKCFSNDDWAGSKEDRRSTSGYYVFVRGNLISWESKKQSAVSCSSSEYRAMAKSVCGYINYSRKWVLRSLCQLSYGVITKLHSTLQMLNDQLS